MPVSAAEREARLDAFAEIMAGMVRRRRAQLAAAAADKNAGAVPSPPASPRMSVVGSEGASSRRTA